MKEDDVIDTWLAGWLGFISGVITVLIAVAVALTLGSCVASHPAPVGVLPASPVQLRPDSLATLPPYLVPAPVGSTPKQRRQWQKAQTQNLALSGILPAKVKNSSVATAPGATSINRPTSAVATGSGAATDARKAGQRGGASAVGPGAIATATSSGPPWWLYVLVAVLGALGWEVLTHYAVPAQWLPWRIAPA